MGAAVSKAASLIGSVGGAAAMPPMMSNHAIMPSSSSNNPNNNNNNILTGMTNAAVGPLRGNQPAMVPEPPMSTLKLKGLPGVEGFANTSIRHPLDPLSVR